jgi:hypothetical protein
MNFPGLEAIGLSKHCLISTSNQLECNGTAGDEGGGVEGLSW